MLEFNSSVLAALQPLLLYKCWKADNLRRRFSHLNNNQWWSAAYFIRRFSNLYYHQRRRWLSGGQPWRLSHPHYTPRRLAVRTQWWFCHLYYYLHRWLSGSWRLCHIHDHSQWPTARRHWGLSNFYNHKQWWSADNKWLDHLYYHKQWWHAESLQ